MKQIIVGTEVEKWKCFCSFWEKIFCLLVLDPLIKKSRPSKKGFFFGLLLLLLTIGIRGEAWICCGESCYEKMFEIND